MLMLYANVYSMLMLKAYEKYKCLYLDMHTYICKEVYLDMCTYYINNIIINNKVYCRKG